MTQETLEKSPVQTFGTTNRPTRTNKPTTTGISNKTSYYAWGIPRMIFFNNLNSKYNKACHQAASAGGRFLNSVVGNV
jgi:hypothetical protein